MCTMRAPLNRLPGWSSGSYGYHGEDGLHFSGAGAGTPYGPSYTRQDGDVIGCVVNFVDKSLSYTRNGALLGIAVQRLPIEEPLYPMVGMRTPGEVVEVNFGEGPFRYDIAALRTAVKTATEASIRSDAQIALGRSASAQLVLDYLVHHGYKEAAVAFAASSGVEELTLAKKANMEKRRSIVRLVVDGAIDEALALIQELYSGLFEARPDVLFQLKCQRFVEAIRAQPLEESVAYCLAELQNPPPGEEDTRDEVLSLLAYPQPSASPMTHVLLPARRSKVAEVLNKAILELHSEPTESRLSKLCKHALVVGEELRESEVPTALLIDLPGMVSGNRGQGEEAEMSGVVRPAL